MFLDVPANRPTKQGSSMYESDRGSPMFSPQDNPSGAGANYNPNPGTPGLMSSVSPGYPPSTTVTHSKVDMDDLPPGTKVGDIVKLKVVSLDKTNNAAFVSSEGNAPDTAQETKDEAQSPEESGVEPTSSQESANKAGSLNTDMLLGPLSKLKNYLAKTSLDQQSQVL